MALGKGLVNRFAESQLWGNNFRKQLWAQLWEHRRGTALGTSSREHLWGAALERNFGEQFSAATLGSNFPQLWGNSFGDVWRTALAQLCGAAQGNSFGEQL